MEQETRAMAILEARGLVKRYGKRTVVNGVDFDVNLGEVVGLLGPNGAGKTTSFRMTTGQVTPNDGTVSFNGNDVTDMPMYRRARLGMGYLAQEHSVFRKLTVEQNILAILEAMPKSRSLGRKLRRSERWDRCDKVLAQFGLTHVRKNNAWRCSGGEKRRLEIARCLVCEPLLILLDEPFAGVDPMTKAEIRQIIRTLCREENIGILLTDHDIREVLKITDRSYLIKDGRVCTTGTPEQLKNDPIAINEYLGTTFLEDGTGAAPTSGRALALVRDGHAASAPSLPLDPASRPTPAPSFSISQMLVMEQLSQTVEALLDDARTEAAARELIARGPAAIPALLAGLERREELLRYRAYLVLQHILPSVTPFDPLAPELVRAHQIAIIRESMRRAA
jgi:lipopolysaccharide export system ATP-binding protein